MLFLELKSLIDKTFKYNIETELFNVVDENRLRIIKDKVKEKLEFISNEDETGLESNDEIF